MYLLEKAENKVLQGKTSVSSGSSGSLTGEQRWGRTIGWIICFDTLLDILNKFLSL